MCPTCSVSYPVVDGVPSFILSAEPTDLKKFFMQVAERTGSGSSYVPYESPAFDLQLRLLSRAFDRSLSRWIEPGSALLDVGCGHGALLAPAVGRYRVSGIDFVRESLFAARDRGYEVYHGDATALPFADAQFDAVVCAEVLQQFADPRPIVEELVRVCRPGGAVIISTLNAKSLVRRFARLLARREFPVPVILRKASEVEKLVAGLPVATREVAWVLSPTHAVAYSRASRAVIAPLATNFILCFSATTS